MKTALVSLALVSLLFVLVGTTATQAQTPAFTYQGRLTQSSMPANGQYDMQFRLFDDPDAGEGTQHGPVVSLPAVQVSSGVFTVQLDFGSAATCPTCFDGSDRYLEISLRPAGSAGGYTDLGPRPKINSAPYANRSALASNALNLGGTAASQYVQSNDTRLSDARNPLPGSTSYIQNTVSPQSGPANFNILGNGVIGNRLTIGNGSAGQPTLRFAGSSNTGIFSSAPDTLNFSIGGVSQVSIDPLGRVGLGTTSPSSILALNGNSPQTIKMERSTVADAHGQTLVIQAGSAAAGGTNRNGGNLLLHSGMSTGAGIGSSIYFQTPTQGASGTADNAPALRMEISGAGNVGIGSIAFSDRRLIVRRDGLENTNSTGLHVLNNTTSTDTTQFHTKYGAQIETSGSVTYDNMALRLSNTSTNALRDAVDKFGLHIGSSGPFAGMGGVPTKNYGLYVLVSGADENYAASFNGGNVGIGTLTPVDPLDVDGDIRVGTGTTGCVKDSDATVIAGTCSSDGRYKKNITSFPGVLDRLVKLRPVNFYWRADEYKERSFGASQSFGLVAQEVEEVMPDLVTTDDKGYRAVRYNKLPLLLLQAVRELKSENDALKHRLQQQTLEQKNRDHRQQKQIDALTKLVCAQNQQAEVCKEEK